MKLILIAIIVFSFSVGAFTATLVGTWIWQRATQVQPPVYIAPQPHTPWHP